MAKYLAFLVAFTVISADLGLITAEAARLNRDRTQIGTTEALVGASEAAQAKALGEIQRASRLVLRLQDANSQTSSATPVLRSDI